jgi:guanine deaminase
LIRASPAAGSTNLRLSRIFRGSVVHSLALGQLEVLDDALLVVSPKGTILELVDLNTLKDESARAAKIDSLTIRQGVPLTTLTKTQLLVPGFIDGHAHAPQYAFVGTGMDLPLLQWLETYTFKCEAKFNDLKFAHKVRQNQPKLNGGGKGSNCCCFHDEHSSTNHNSLSLFVTNNIDR